MDKKHLIMGTAGHVDHGKTTLIKALTGFDCDTHKQEKQRTKILNRSGRSGKTSENPVSPTLLYYELKFY
jgi:translation initiation factor 2 gamma subunit (eIF-2gamma)